MVSFIDEHRDELGVEPICTALQVAPSTYYAAKKRQPSARALRDAFLKNVLFVLWSTNRKVYGAHKLWKAAQRAGHDVGRDQVARLMRELGIRGVSRCRKRVFTTRSDPEAGRPPDLVKRDFSAAQPNGLWVTDLTYVPTRTGMAYVCFITDAFSRMIVGWRVAAHMRTDMVLDALEMARHSRRAGRLVGLVTHSDAGSQFTSVRFTERLDEIGAHPEHRDRRRFVRQCPRRGDQRPLQDRMRLRARRQRLGRRQPPRAGHAVVGALVQRRAPPRLLRRHPAGGVRSSVLRWQPPGPTGAWKPITRASIRPRAIHHRPPGPRTYVVDPGPLHLRHTWATIWSGSYQVIGRPTVVSGLSSGGVLAAWLSAYAKPGQIRGGRTTSTPPLFHCEMRPEVDRGTTAASAECSPFHRSTWATSGPWATRGHSGELCQRGLPLDGPLAATFAGGVPQNMKEYDPEWARACWEGTISASCNHAAMLARVNVPVLFTHHFRGTDEASGDEMGASSEEQAARVVELVTATGQPLPRTSRSPRWATPCTGRTRRCSPKS